MPQRPLGTPDDRPSRWPRRGVEASSGPACPAAGESSDTPTPSRGQLNAECQSVILPPRPALGCSMPPPQTHQPSRPLPGQRFVWNPDQQSVRLQGKRTPGHGYSRWLPAGLGPGIIPGRTTM